MANNIVEFNIDGTSYTQRPYGTCSTAAGTAAKTVTCSGFNLVTGATVMVKFTNANTVANPTLNVNSKGAKAIYYRGAALTASSLANWGAGDVVEFRYNGTQWDLLNVGNTAGEGEANVQSDWNVTDTTSDAYIKNKPTIPTIPTIGNGTITIKQNGTSKGTFTVNQTGNTTIELTDTDTNTNYYPTTFAWTNGSSAGPTGSLTGSGMSAVSFGAIPSASASISGVVTTGAQTFAGNKTFNGSINSSKLSVTTTNTEMTSPTSQMIVLNSTSSDAIADAPGIGFHVPNKGWATLKFISAGNAFRLYNSELTDYVNLYVKDLYEDGTKLSNKYQAKGTYLTSQDHYKTSVTAGTAGTSSATSGSTLAVPYVTVNANGHVTGYGTHTHTISGFLTSETYKGTVTSITPGTGLTGTSSDTAITSSGTINLKVASSSEIGGVKPGTTNGKTYGVAVSSTGEMTVNVPWTDTDTDTKVTSVANHYEPAENTSAAITATGGTATNITGTSGKLNVVTGLKRDAKGHVVGVTCANIYSTDNASGGSDTKVTQTVTTSNANYPILLAPSSQTTTTTGTAYFETAIKINPSTGKITGVDYISSDSTDLHIQCDEWLILDGGGDGCGIRPNSSSINDCDLGTTSIRFRDGFFSNKVYAANGFYESSDERLKDFGEGLSVDLDALSKLRKSYFTFKDKPEDPQIGVSAQEIQKLYPEVVIETSDGHLNVDYAKLSVVALAAIDQLNDKVKSLEDRLARLEKLLENK